MNKKISIILITLFSIAILSACGSKKDACPSMGLENQTNSIELTA